MKNKVPVALGKYLIVQLVENEGSKIIIPDTANQATAGSVWMVRSVGPKCECGAKVGDQVIISTPATHEFSHNKQTYWAVPDIGVAVVLR
jgi:co-chaperonin GroES (HSP10)